MRLTVLAYYPNSIETWKMITRVRWAWHKLIQRRAMIVEMMA